MKRCPSQSEYHERAAVSEAEHALAPHERTWTVECRDHDPDDRGDVKDCWLVEVPTPGRYTDGCLYLSGLQLCFYNDAREAKLAAQAPAMARLLLEMGGQFSDVSDDGYRRCAFCGGEAHAVHPVPHHATCKLVAVLRAAGVLP